MKGKLYLIPNRLGENNLYQFQLDYGTVLNDLSYLMVENGKEARKLLKHIPNLKDLNDFEYLELNKRTDAETYSTYLQFLLSGKHLGIISDAGCPGIADPGSELVRLAHENGIHVVPLIGPSSIVLALMASGFNGQSFTFHGYLPKERADRIKSLKDMETASGRLNQTQLFIETPYRNNHMMEDILTHCRDSTMLCVAANLTQKKEFILSLNIASWKKRKWNFDKIPAVFLLYRK